MPKLNATRENVFAVADALALRKGAPERVTAADVGRRIADHKGRVARFFAEWRERATGAPPAELRRAIEAITDAFWRERNADRSGEAANAPAAAVAPPPAGRRRRGRPPKAARTTAHERGSFLAIKAAGKGPPKPFNARPKAAGASVRRSRKGRYSRRRITPEERKARQSGAAALHERLTANARRSAAPPRKKIRRSDWAGAVDTRLARATAAHLRDLGHALRSFEIRDHLVARHNWRGGRPDRVIPGILEGSRIGACGRGFWWFDYEEPPYRSRKPTYRPVDSDPAAVVGLGKLRFEEALDVLRKATHPLRPVEIKDELVDVDGQFTESWLRQRLRRESEKPDGAVERTADGRYAVRKKKPPARGGRR